MSNLTPFGGDVPSESIPEQLGSDLEIFKPPLEGFDWAAYEERQAQLDEALKANAIYDPTALAGTLMQLHAVDPSLGIKLNNVHNTVVTGDLAGLSAPLAVMSKSDIKTDIPDLNFNGGVASRASFAGQNFKSAEFVDSILTGATFAGAVLDGADFTNATLTDADFTGASLRGVDMSGAYLVGVTGLTDSKDIAGIKLTGARTIVSRDAIPEGKMEQFLASHFGDSTKLETIIRMLDAVPVAIEVQVPRLQTKRNLRGLVAHRMIANDVDFSSSQLVGARIEDMNARDAQFRAAMMSGAMILNSLMRGVDLVSTWAPGLVLEDVDLRGSRLTNANLVGSVFRGVDLRDVEGLAASETNLEGIVLEDCKLPQGFGYDGVALQRTQKLQRELD